MQQLKKKVRKSAQPLQQIIHRTTEEYNITQYTNITENDSSAKLLMEHFDGPLINNCTSPQYRKAQIDNYYLNILKIADRFVELKTNVIVEIKNFASYKNSVL